MKQHSNSQEAQQASELLLAIMLRQHEMFPNATLEPTKMPSELAGLNLMFIKTTFDVKPEMLLIMSATSVNPVFTFISEELVGGNINDAVEDGETVFGRFLTWVTKNFAADNVSEESMKEATSLALIEYSQTLQTIYQG